MEDVVKNDNRTVKPVDERQKWIKRTSIIVAIWGILSLLFSLPEIGVIFILFAIVIYLTKSFIGIYVVGILLWIIAIVELFNLTGPLGITVSSAQGPELILVAIINFVIGTLFIYKTWKLK
ncbi:hypothetical protein [Methanobacterium spitsbergense]|uniref:Uncharacterized protein n=1 Tax=Methanobacterium spitsbergense TaxID=2874285 RepID=A0A8T5ULR2_9EURY|nr:hypothetical protein [Methanobacterium spitsbergense]MBZ2164624.1 hypothetical protein [Methanobacterium spitsbergense]